MAPFTNTSTRSILQSDIGTPVKDLFQCLDPANSLMKNYNDRLNTFYQNPIKIAATAEQLAEAGFFHIGIGDKTKCFYCNGGLENWMHTDDPMVEHAKWYPDCEYILKKQGFEFVSSVASTFPDLGRPRNPPTQPTPPRNTLMVSSFNVPMGASIVITQTETVEISSPTLESKVEEAMLNSLTMTMSEFGFSDDVIRNVLERRLMTSDMFNSASGFLDAIHQFEDQEEQQSLISQFDQTLAPVSWPLEPRGEMPQVSNVEKSVEVKIKELKRLHSCKICFERETSCVMHPCGHLCACNECAKQLKKCPLCRTKVTEIFKIYAA